MAYLASLSLWTPFHTVANSERVRAAVHLKVPVLVSHSLNLLFHEKFLNALVEVNSTHAGTLEQQNEYFPLMIAFYD